MSVFHSREPITIIEAANWSRHVGPQRKKLIVLHCMEHDSKELSAEWCGKFFAGLLRDKKGNPVPAPQASANFCIDANSTVQCVPAEMVAWHAPGANKQGIGIELPGFARYTRDQWMTGLPRQMLLRAAQFTAELCQHFAIPCAFLDAEDLRADLTGITTHEQCTLAWPEKKGTHTDPGRGFPIRDYLDWVRSYTGSAWAEV